MQNSPANAISAGKELLVYVVALPPNPVWRRAGGRRSNTAIDRALFENGPVWLNFAVERIRGRGASGACIGNQEIPGRLLDDADGRIDLQFTRRGARGIAVIPDDLRCISRMQIQANEALKARRWSDLRQNYNWRRHAAPERIDVLHQSFRKRAC